MLLFLPKQVFMNKWPLLLEYKNSKNLSEFVIVQNMPELDNFFYALEHNRLDISQYDPTAVQIIAPEGGYIYRDHGLYYITDEMPDFGFAVD